MVTIEGFEPPGQRVVANRHWAVEPTPQPIYNSLKPLSHIIIKSKSHLHCSECYPAVLLPSAELIRIANNSKFGSGSRI